MEISLQVQGIKIWSDSRLVVGQVNAQFEARENCMRQYKEVVLELLEQFQQWELQQILCTKNAETNLLSCLTHGLEENLEYISGIAQVVDMDAPSIIRDRVMVILPAEDEWMNELILYKTHGTMPNDLLQKEKVLAIAPSY